jgi:hypothetical protein
MDILALLSQAMVTDRSGVRIGVVEGIHLVAGKMSLALDVDLDLVFGEDEDDPDPDDEEEQDIPDDDASQGGFPKLAVVDGRVGESK